MGASEGSWMDLKQSVSEEKRAVFPSKSMLVYFVEVNCLLYVKDSKSVDAIC